MSDLDEFGFTWDQVTVTRLTDFKGYKVLRVATHADKHIDIYVSPAGRSIRVFGGGEWKPMHAAWHSARRRALEQRNALEATESELARVKAEHADGRIGTIDIRHLIEAEIAIARLTMDSAGRPVPHNVTKVARAVANAFELEIDDDSDAARETYLYDTEGGHSE